jgi:hypothetical protein
MNRLNSLKMLAQMLSTKRSRSLSTTTNEENIERARGMVLSDSRVKWQIVRILDMVLLDSRVKRQIVRILAMVLPKKSST